MTLRDKRREEFVNKWIESGEEGILNLCPRFGKTRTGIEIFQRGEYKSILIAYPDSTIKDSWEKEFEICSYDSSDITFTTYYSLSKHEDEVYDLIVLDEIHTMSDNQLDVMRRMMRNNKKILGLTGTLSTYTEVNIGRKTGLIVVGEYPIEKGIEEKIITDYEIVIVKTKLDKTIPTYKGKSEKVKFGAYSFIINKLEKEKRDTKFMRLNRMRIIQDSIGKLSTTINLLEQLKDERVLVFCGKIEIAEKLGIPTFHSENRDEEVFDGFMKGEFNQLAVVKLGNTGVTYTPLNKVVINYFDSNPENLTQKILRCMSLEYNNPDKKAEIYIISTDEEVELKWLNKALNFLDESKIKYI